MRARASCFISALCLALSACAVQRPPAPWEGDPPTVSALREGLLERAAAVRTLRIRGTGEVLRGETGQARRFQAQATLEPPHRFRLFGYVGAFAPLFTLTVREDGFGLHLPLRREVFVANPADTLVIEGEKMPVPPADVWPVFLPDRLAKRIAGEAALVIENGAYRVDWSGPQGSESLWVSRPEGDVVRYRGESPGGETLELRYDGYARRDGLWYPERITVSLREIGVETRFRITGMDLNPRLSADAFALRFPADATIRHVGRPPEP